MSVLAQDTLSNILHIKYGLRRQSLCCKDFVPSKEMLERFNNHIGNMETDSNKNSDGGL